MDKLVEKILKNELVSATEIFEERMATIAEKKLYEAKRSIAANIDEALGGMTRAEIEAKKKAGYRKAADVLSDPRDIKIEPLVKTKKKAVKEETLDEAGLAAATKAARELAKSPIKKKLFRTAMQLKRMGGKPIKPARRAADQDQDLRKTFGVERPEDNKGPGRVQRNINTLMGREPGYKPEPKTPEQKGGRVGKVVRAGGKVGGGILRTAAKLAGDVFAGLEE